MNPLAVASTAPTSRATYARHWRRFCVWCEANLCTPLPATPDVVAAYLYDCHANGERHSSLRAYASAISVHHQDAGHDSPTWSTLVKRTLQGAARVASPPRRAPALPLDALELLVGRSPNPETRAVLLVGFWGGLRGDDLAGLLREHIEPTDWGVVLNVRGKTERGPALRRVPLARRGDSLCPVGALEAWLEFRLFSEADSHVFPSPGRGRDYVLGHLRAACKTAGVRCTWTAHSLRAGIVTAAHAAGVSEADIAVTTGHRSVSTLRGYIREADLCARSLTTRVAPTKRPPGAQ